MTLKLIWGFCLRMCLCIPKKSKKVSLNFEHNTFYRATPGYSRAQYVKVGLISIQARISFRFQNFNLISLLTWIVGRFFMNSAAWFYKNSLISPGNAGLFQSTICLGRAYIHLSSNFVSIPAFQFEILWNKIFRLFFVDLDVYLLYEYPVISSVSALIIKYDARDSSLGFSLNNLRL